MQKTKKGFPSIIHIILGLIWVLIGALLYSGNTALLWISVGVIMIFIGVLNMRGKKITCKTCG